MTPSGRFYCYAILFEETEAQGKFNTLSKVTQLISGGTYIESRQFDHF